MCCGVGDDLVMSHGIKSPRLVGMWAQQRFLHNGSVDSLEALLCDSERPTVDAPVFSDAGHRYGCDLAAEDRASLISYLLAH